MPIRERERGLHLFALSALAVAQPLLDLLAGNPGFLVAHQLRPSEILAFVVLLLTAPPAAAWIVVALASRLSAVLGTGIQLGFIGAFSALAALPVLAGFEGLPGVGAVALALAFGGLAALGYARFAVLRSFASVLALAAPVFAGVFLTSEPIAKLLATPAAEPIADGGIASDTPIVMVFFDELPLVSLLDADEQIDASRYPAFARLAREGTWYRNATTVHAQTHLAVPAMLTGRYAPPTFVPVAAAHPENLFRLLAGVYEMNVHEMETALLPDEQNDREAVAVAARPRAAAFLSDLRILALHRWLPADLARSLPPITGTWRDFATDPQPARPAAGAYQVRDVRFRKFIASIAPSERPALHFFHALLPHTPFNFLPSGRRYFPVDLFGQTKQTWGGDPWWVTQAWQRHLLQLAFVDRLLGELLDRLDAIGLYDDALLVIAADHGGGFWPGEARRNPVLAAHPEDVLRIPLFIKAPGQRAGRTSDRNVETIDLLPTLAQHLGVEIPWEMHGCSALDPGCPERDRKVFVTSLGKRIPLELDAIRSRATLERKLAQFGAGPDGLHRIGRHHALIGRSTAELAERGSADVTARLPAATFEFAANDPQFTLARITGRLLGKAPGPRPSVAVAVDGVVVAVAPALPQPGAGLLFSAMLPEGLAPANADALSLWLVDGTPDAARLRRIPMAIGKGPATAPATGDSLDRR